MIHVDALDFSGWHSEEVISFFWRSVYNMSEPYFKIPAKSFAYLPKTTYSNKKKCSDIHLDIIFSCGDFVDFTNHGWNKIILNLYNTN